MQILLRFLLLLLVLPAAPARPPARQDPAGLLAAQRAGLGAPAALAKLGVVRSSGTMAFEGFEGQGAYTEILAPDGSARLEALFEGTPPSLRCTNGVVFWMTGTGGLEVKIGWSAAADVRLFGLGRHRDWQEIYSKAELVGEAQVGGRACYELQLTPKTPVELGLPPEPGEEPPAPDTWWLDRGSQELVRVAIYATVSGAGWQRLVLDYSDWRPAGGVRFPFKSRMTFGPPDHPIAIALERQSLEVDAPFKSGEFQPEDKVLSQYASVIKGVPADDPGFALQTKRELLTATVRVKCKPADLQQQLATILPEVMGYLQRARVGPAGAPFARYHAFGPDLIDLEAGIPVAQKVAGEGRIKPSSLPGGDVVSGWHTGPYQKLTQTHAALARWLAEQNLAAQGGPWEVYWTDPGLQSDPAKWRTEVLQPVAVPAGVREALARKTGAGAEAPPPGEDAALKRLGILVGTWKVTGEAVGEVSFEWLAGGHFLVQRIELTHDGRHMQGLEIIGRERRFGEEPGAAITSHSYDDLGNTLDCTWELEGSTLTIWGGEKGSPAYYRGTFSADGNTLTGAWTWPGGGYTSTATRAAEPRNP